MCFVFFRRSPGLQVTDMANMIKDIPEEQRPYEKCLAAGEEALSDGELLAVILRSGTRGCGSLDLANRVLAFTKNSSYPGLGGLRHMTVQELTTIPGIGRVKALQLKCIGELCRRIAREPVRGSVTWNDPETIADYYMEQLRHEEQELLYVVMMDNRNHFMGERLISRGTANATLASPREIFVEALRRHAIGIVLVHNHPSGDPEPSLEDITLTRKVQESGEMVGICLHDHIIIGDQQYYSFQEQGLIRTE